MIEGTHLTMFIDGKQVKGEITLLEKGDLCIKITSPYTGHETSTHVPALARGHVSFTEPDDKLNDYGAKRAQELLEELYRFLVYFDENRTVLERRYVEMTERARGLEDTFFSDERFAEEKRKLKMQLKAGDIDNTAYQKRLTPLRESNERLEAERYLLWDEFVEENFPDGIPLVPQNLGVGAFDGRSLHDLINDTSRDF